MTQQHSKWFPRLAFLVALLGLSACAGLPSKPLARAPQEAPVEVVRVEQTAPSPALIRGLAEVSVEIADFPPRGPGHISWQRRVLMIEDLAAQGYLTQAQDRLSALRQEVSAQVADYYRSQALRYHRQAQQFARLNSDQYDRLRALDFAVHQGAFKTAYFQGRALVRELWAAQAWVTVRSGDTLASIAARREVYDNPNLWPLLKSANKGLLFRNPPLQSGWRLRYPLHPRLDEIFAAVEGLY